MKTYSDRNQSDSSIERDDQIKGRPASMPDQIDLDAGFEVSDWDIGASVRILIGIVIFTAISFVVVTGFQWAVTGNLGDFTPPAEGIADVPDSPVPGRIESRAATGSEVRDLRASEMDKLSTYGWVDEAAGTVHIPIDEAMDRAIEEGLLPARPAAEGSQFRDTGEDDLPSDTNSGRGQE